MPKNDEMPDDPAGPGEDEWNVVLDEDFVRGASIHESAAPGPTRTWALVLGLLLLMGLLALVTLDLTDPSDEERVTVRPRRTASPTAAPSPSASAAPAAGRPAVPPADVFPAEVPDGSGGTFVRVATKVLGSCSEPDSAGPRLAAMLAEGKGCVGGETALYKDDGNNQFTIAVFTLRDPADTVRVVTGLTTAPDDHQVGVQAPPPGSGLAVLGPGAGLVQSFSGTGRVVVAALGQWSDGRTADLRQLSERLQPLQRAVDEQVERYEETVAP